MKALRNLRSLFKSNKARNRNLAKQGKDEYGRVKQPKKAAVNSRRHTRNGAGIDWELFAKNMDARMRHRSIKKYGVTGEKGIGPHQIKVSSLDVEKGLVKRRLSELIQ